MQQRFALLRLLAELSHAVEQFLHLLLLLRHLPALRRILHVLLDVRPRLLLILQRLADLLFILRSITRLLADLLHLLGKFLRSLLPEILLHLFQLTLRARRGVRRIRQLFFLQLLRRLTHLLTRFVQLLLRLRHVLRVLRLLHALLEIIQIAQQLLLLGLQTLELVVQLLLLLLRLRLGDLILKFLDLLRQRLLPPRQFLQPVQHLQVLLLLRRLLFRRGLLLFVALLLLLQFKIHDLVLVRLLPGPLLRLVLPHHLVLTALRTVQPFQRRLFKRQRLIQRRSLLLRRSLLQRPLRILEALPRLRQRLLHLRILRLLHRLLHLFQGDPRGLMHHVDVRHRRLDHSPRVRVTDDLPRRVHQLLHQIHQLVALRLRLPRLAGRSLHLAENIFKMPHIGKEHVAHAPPHLALRPRVLRP